MADEYTTQDRLEIYSELLEAAVKEIAKAQLLLAEAKAHNENDFPLSVRATVRSALDRVRHSNKMSVQAEDGLHRLDHHLQGERVVA